MKNTDSGRLALVFPGIGYTVDKPLLYYAKKLAAKQGFAIADVPYTGFPSGAKGSTEKMRQAFDIALSQTEAMLKDVDFSSYSSILCISKSIGTAVAAAYTERHSLSAYNIYFTPLELTFSFPVQEGIAFHGTADPWVETELLSSLCAEHGLPLHIIADANHSLETSDIPLDIKNLQSVMQTADNYVRWLCRIS